MSARLVCTLFLLGSTSVIVYAVPQQKNESCRTNRTQNGDNCYFAEFTNATTWLEAQKTCRQMNMNLVSINNERENSFIHSMIKDKSQKIWIGLKRQPGGTLNGFAWIDGSLANFTKWKSGEPNNEYGNEDYVEMLYWNGEWNDLPLARGGEIKKSFICKTQILETTASTTQVTTSHGHHDITCTESRMEFSIPLSSPHTSETATLSDPNCQINLTRTHVRGGVDLNSCGTTVQFQNDSVIFRNAIIFSAPASSSLGSNGSDDSVSQYQDIIPIECVYNRIATVHLSYMPVVRRVLFTESGVGQFSFNIQQFWDASFTSVVSDRAYPLRLEQDADIFIQLSVGSEGQPVAGHKEIGMEVQQCLVSPSSSVIEAQLHYYPLIQDGCPASSDVHIIPNTNASDSTVMRFRFRAVNFFDPSSSSSSSLVFVHCRMGLCLTGSCKPSAWTCLTPPARRVRRDVDQSRRAAHQLSTGPFLIMADEASASSSSTTATVMAVVSTSVATVAIVVAAIALIALRRRRTTARN